MKTISKAIAIVATALAMLASCTTRQRHDMTHFQQQADSLLSTVFAADKPGAAVLVMQGDSVLFEGC